MTPPLLSVAGLGVRLGPVALTRDITFDIASGERVGLIGESGCGKSITGLALLGLLPSGARREGRAIFDGRDLPARDEAAWRRIRGRDIAMVFQEPMTALDPVFTVGEQIVETLRLHQRLSRRAARAQAIEMLDKVGIPAPTQRFSAYPHELSGGMRQRALIAIALCCAPRLLIADEPTTALDVTVQAQILDLLVDLADRNGTALLFISHDLGVVADLCTRILTMYAGEIVEDARTEALLRCPRHPYSAGLMHAMPRLAPRKSKLAAIAGRVPPPGAMPEGCRFAPRCDFRTTACAHPPSLTSAQGHKARCVRQDEIILNGVI